MELESYRIFICLASWVGHTFVHVLVIIIVIIMVIRSSRGRRIFEGSKLGLAHLLVISAGYGGLRGTGRGQGSVSELCNTPRELLARLTHQHLFIILFYFYFLR